MADSDILSQLLSSSNNQQAHIVNIENTLRGIATDNRNSISQSAARQALNTQRDNAANANRTDNIFRSKNKARTGIKSVDDAISQVYEGIGESLTASIKDATSGFTDELKGQLSVIAHGMGIELNDVPKMLGRSIASSLKDSAIGRSIKGSLAGLANSARGPLEGYTRNLVARNPQAFRGMSYDQIRASMLNTPGAFRNGRTVTSGRSAGVLGNALGFNTSSRNDNFDYLSNIDDNVDSIYLLLADNYASMNLYKKQALNDDKNNLIDALSSGDTDKIIDGLGLDISDFKDLGQIKDLLAEDGGFAKLLTKSSKGELLNVLGEDGLLSIFGGGAEAGAVTAGTEAAAVGAGAGGAGALSLGALGGPLGIAAVLAVIVALDQFTDAIGPAIEGIQNFTGTLENTGNRFYSSQKKFLEEEQKRLAADINTMIQYPFDIMKKAADEWYSAWDSNLRTINQTQGYSKADLQTLMGNFAESIREQGLGSVVSAVDITDNLAKVLNTGLSGKVAEEFAFLATKLNAAVPTQDFFSYAETYASVAANAMQAGASQAEAIEKANAQLEQFASNVLYANRELAGGFSTGLQNASSLFNDAVKIANAARVGDASNISAVLTSVSAMVGAVAPDLVDGIVSNIVSAATGGNSSAITALRSLAGTGASNTAFLQAFASNPKQVFTTLFSNLSNMQNMSSDNYMEVAEALADTFGVSMDAFARVDFASLASAVDAMKVNMQSLDLSMDLLKSGQSTTSAEQLKMQQINEMIIDEGLSYVLDNEAARMIQEHMWDQELAKEMQETTYGVELIGATQDLLLSISETIHGIFSILNPFSWAEKIANVSVSALDQSALKSDLKNMLELGKVGNRNTSALKKLTTYNANSLDSRANLVEMLGGVSAYRTSSGISKAVMGTTRALTNAAYGGVAGAASELILNGIAHSLNDSYGGGSRMITAGAPNVTSKYGWAFVGKSLSSALSKVTPQGELTQLSATSVMADKSSQKLQSFLDTAEGAVKANKSYDEWRATASEFGIKDLNAALGEAGIRESELEGNFQRRQAQKASEYNAQKDELERKFWEEGEKFWTETYPHYAQEQINRQDIEIQWLTDIYNELVVFYNSFMTDWLAQAWKSDWVDSTFTNEWMNRTFKDEWMNDAFLTQWLKDEFATNFREKAFGEDLIRTALEEHLIQDTINSRLIAGAIDERLINTAINTNLISDAIKSQLIDRAIEGDWINKAWNEDWLTNAWAKDFVLTAFGTDLVKDTLNDALIGKAINENWLGENGAWTSFVNDTWGNEWIKGAWQDFVNAWTDYFINHVAYTEATGDVSDIAMLNNMKSDKEDSTGEAVVELAERLIQQTQDMTDPQVQTNLLLSQLVVLAQAILQAENTSSGAALATSLSGLATNQTTSV